MLCLAFPKNGFIFVTQNLQKSGKCFVKTLATFVFELKAAPKPFPNKVLMPNFRFE